MSKVGPLPPWPSAMKEPSYPVYCGLTFRLTCRRVTEESRDLRTNPSVIGMDRTFLVAAEIVVRS